LSTIYYFTSFYNLSVEETWQKNKFNSDYLFETKRKAKVMKKILLTIFTAVILLSVLAGCNESDPQLSDNAAVTNKTEGTTDKVTNEAPTETTDAVTGNVADNGDNDSLSAEVFIPEDFVYPGTDGSTSTTNLEKAVKKAIFGSEQPVKHSKTYQAFNNLLEKPQEYKLIFTTPLSEIQIQQMEEKGYKYEAEPVAGEGFVFVVNKNNPVDTLTVEQLKGIYSGKITNWSQVGGNDAKIIAYQRNADSGSQNYMISFMGDTPLMAPNTDTIPASMGQILDVVANYDNAVDAIGYSVYAYSDGMYENISEIKYIKVNGVEPSLKTLADGTYPLLGYNYAVFSAEEPEDSDVRLLVKWIQSDAGQQVVTDAGYVPYRKVEGLTLPDPTNKILYTAEASSGIEKTSEISDYYYQTYTYEKKYESAADISYKLDMFTSDTLNRKVNDFIRNSADELSYYDEEAYVSYLNDLEEIHESRTGSGLGFGSFMNHRFIVRQSLKNGYFSVTVAIAYYDGIQDLKRYFFDVRTAVFDIYTEERLELSDLFFDGVDFVPLLNNYLAAESLMPYSGFGTCHEMKRDFSGLCTDNFTFTADSIIFGRDSDFVCGGVELSLSGLDEYMVTSVPRDMKGKLKETVPIYKIIKSGGGSAAEKEETIDVWYLAKGNAFVSDMVCDKVNTFAKKLYESYFTQEKLNENAKNRGYDAEKVTFDFGWPSLNINVMGKRYIEFTGVNLAYSYKDDKSFGIIPGNEERNFYYYFDPETGEELNLDDNTLFIDGWQEAASYYYNSSFNGKTNYYLDEPFATEEGIKSGVKYDKNLDIGNCTVKNIQGYNISASQPDFEMIDKLVYIDVLTESGDRVAIFVPREYIK